MFLTKNILTHFNTSDSYVGLEVQPQYAKEEDTLVADLNITDFFSFYFSSDPDDQCDKQLSRTITT